MSAISSGYTALDILCPLHSNQLSASAGHEADGQAITVPIGIEDVATLCTMTLVGSKLVLSAARTGLEKTSDTKRRKRKR